MFLYVSERGKDNALFCLSSLAHLCHLVNIKLSTVYFIILIYNFYYIFIIRHADFWD